MFKSKINREISTAKIMITLYCHKKHQTNSDSLCKDCEQLLNYATERLKHCKFANNKPQCKKCEIHCYNLKQKEKIKEVMRFSGPRMFLKHPLLALLHLLN